MQNDTLILNQWMRAQGRTRRNLAVIGCFSTIVAPGLATARTDVTAIDSTDNIRFTATGAGIAGRELATVISGLVPASFDLSTAEKIDGGWVPR